MNLTFFDVILIVYNNCIQQFHIQQEKKKVFIPQDIHVEKESLQIDNLLI